MIFKEFQMTLQDICHSSTFKKFKKQDKDCRKDSTWLSSILGIWIIEMALSWRGSKGSSSKSNRSLHITYPIASAEKPFNVLNSNSQHFQVYSKFLYCTVCPFKKRSEACTHEYSDVQAYSFLSN